MNIDPIIAQPLANLNTVWQSNISTVNTQSFSPEAVNTFNAIYNADAPQATTPVTTPQAIEPPKSMDAIIANMNAGGGIMSPSALLRAQGELMSLQINWLITSQVTGKVGSGIQTVLNNQV